MTILAFNDFEMDLHTRHLTHLGTRIRLGSRAFDILAVMASRPGQLVSKDEILAEVWATTHVDEGSLRVHLVALRKALASKNTAEFIQNLPGRGYLFAQQVRRLDTRSDRVPSSASGIVSEQSIASNSVHRPAADLIPVDGHVDAMAALDGIKRLSKVLSIARQIIDRYRPFLPPRRWLVDECKHDSPVRHRCADHGYLA